MRVLLALASIAMLASAEPPTGYSHRSSNSDLNFQPVPSVAQIHIPPSSQTHSRQYVMPQYYSTLEKQNPGPQVVYSPSNSHYTAPSASARSSTHQHTSSSNQLSQYSPAPQQFETAASSHQQYAAPSSNQYTTQTSYNAPTQQTQQSQQQQSYSAPSSSQSYSTPSSSQSYAAPSSSQSYSAPSSSQSYSAPSSSQSYSAPQQQQQQSQPQQPQYAAPSLSSQQYSSPTNVQVAYGSPQLPPGALGYGPPPIVTGAGPDHNVEYRVVYVKGPKAQKPDLILPPPPPQQKTLVYILVPRVEPPEPIIVPTHPPTPPSKPEVFFIRYKAPKKARQQQTYSAPPSSSYGSPIGSASVNEPVVVEAPTKSESTKVLVRKSSSSSESSFGDRVTSSESS